MTCRVLVIEDEPDILLLLQVTLEGCRVDPVVSLAQARAVLAVDDRYEVIVLDAGLADGNGLELIEERNNKGLTVPMIVVTGNPHLAQRAAEAGAHAFVTKPFSPDALRALVQKASGHHHDNEDTPEQDEAEGGSK